MGSRRRPAVCGPCCAAVWSRACAVLLFVGACEEGEEVVRLERAGSAPAEGAAPSSATSQAGPAGAAGEGGEASAPVAAVYRDEDFVESERNRDPFRNYEKAFRAQPPEEIQRRVVMPTTAVEEMKLIAIVGGIARPKAMLLDATGTGHVVERGVYVGRPKLVQAAGNVAMLLNWRVDRIRDNEVVLTRQDPADPTRPALTRVILLDPDAAKGSELIP